MIACVNGMLYLNEKPPRQGTSFSNRASRLLGRLRVAGRLRYTPACAFKSFLFAQLDSCKPSTVSELQKHQLPDFLDLEFLSRRVVVKFCLLRAKRSVVGMSAMAIVFTGMVMI